MIPIGLDCFWEIDEEDEPNFERELTLTGGLFSGNGQGSFRGKVYNAFVKHFTGISLYEDLSNEQVYEIAETLDALTWDELATVEVKPDGVFLDEEKATFQGGYYGFSDKQDFKDFKLMFRRYADAGAELVAWY